MRKFVVTGCGRSGTAFAAQLLAGAGARVGHEKLFHPATSAPSLEGVDGDVSWYAVPWLGELPDEVVILHLVRHPEPTIGSWLGREVFVRFPWREQIRNLGRRLIHRPLPQAGPLPTWRFLWRHCPHAMQGDSEVARIAQYWVDWNLRVEHESNEKQRLIVRLDELSRPETLVRIFDLLDVVADPVQVSRSAGAPLNVGRGRSAQLALLPSRLRSEVHSLADRYELFR